MFIPSPREFHHPSWIHGQNHVARVMVHALRLLAATGWRAEATRLWGSVYLHDLARTHDGGCRWHGMDAVRRWCKDRQLEAALAARGLHWAHEPHVHRAVIVHCQPPSLEPSPDAAEYPLVALLKDADALDRARFGDLDTRRLRLPQSHAMVSFAEDLYEATHRGVPEGDGHWAGVLEAVHQLLGQPLVVPEELIVDERHGR